MDKYLSRKIEVLSFLSIILVLFLHSSIGGKFDFWKITESAGIVNDIIMLSFPQGITRIAVPLFMLISGYLFFRNVERGGQIIHKYKSRFYSLVIPYLFWELLWLVIVMGVVFLGIKLGVTNESFKSTFFADNLKFDKDLIWTFLRPLPVWQFWFLRDLICLIIISPIIYYLTKTLKFVAVLIVIMIMCFVFAEGDSSDICYKFFEGCYLNRSSASIVFFMLGSYFAICNQKIVFNRCRGLYYPLIFALVWFVTLAFRAYFSYQSNGYIWSCVLFQISVLAGILCVWTGYDIISRKCDLDWLNDYLPYSFFIYCFHIPVMTYMSVAFRFVLLSKVFGVFPRSGLAYALDYFFTPVLVFVMAIVLARITKNKMPGLYRLSTGGR